MARRQANLGQGYSSQPGRAAPDLLPELQFRSAYVSPRVSLLELFLSRRLRLKTPSTLPGRHHQRLTSVGGMGASWMSRR